MKRILVTGAIFLTFIATSFAQKIVYVDTEYILNNIPAYKEAKAEIDKMSAQWQKEIEEKYAEIDKIYKQYQVEKHLLSNDMKVKNEQSITEKEKEVKTLQQKRFGRDGDRFKKEQELLKPIQDEIFNAMEAYASEESIGFIFDASSSSLSMLYSSPKYDVSDDILKKLGYIK